MKSDIENFESLYKILCSEFGDDFQVETEQSVFDRKTTARDIVKLSHEQVDAIQKEYDKENCREIIKAFQTHEINQDEAVFLLNYYRDGMSAYREVYRGLYEIYGIPEMIACMDQKTGALETNPQKVQHIDAENHRIFTTRENITTRYTLKEVTPFTCMRLEYRDNENNPVFVVLPVMKKAKRAIEKVKDYRIRHIRKNYPIFNGREIPADLHSEIKDHLGSVKDILRLTVTRKYYSGVSKTRNTFMRASGLGVKPEETRSLFYDNDMRNSEQLKKNGKNYYDEKMFFHLLNGKGGEYVAEAQIKIEKFYHADLQTHGFYEELRVVEETLLAEREKMTAQQIKRAQYRADLLKKEIQLVNKQANHEYNMMVMEKVRWMEDGYRALRIPPDYSDGTYKACHDLIKINYMVRPHKIFDAGKEFDPRDKSNMDIASRSGYNLNNIFEISQRYREPVSHKYAALHGAVRDQEGDASQYPNYVPGGRYEPKKDKSEWDGYGKAKTFRADMNRNIYNDNYNGSYQRDYESADNERKNAEKQLTDEQIEIYYSNQKTDISTRKSGR